MTPGRAALVALMDRYLRGMMEPFVTLLEVHILLYFMQEAGEPLGLRFEPGPYGPFADNLSHVLHSWSDRKKMFTRRQITLAQDILVQKEWLGNVPDAEN